MKRAYILWIVIFILLMQAKQVCSAPVNLPSCLGQRRSEIDIFKFEKGFLGDFFDDVHGAIGFELDYISDRDVRTKYSKGNPKIEAQFYTFKFLLSFNDWLDIYTNLGSTNGLTYNYNPDINTRTVLTFEDNLTYGIGLSVQLFKSENGLQVFADARHRAINDLEIDKKDGYSYFSATKIDRGSHYEESQCAFGISKEYEFTQNGKSSVLVFYSGVKYSEINMYARGRATKPGNIIFDYDIPPVKAKNDIGGFSGISLSSNVINSDASQSYNAFDIQVRFIDELGVSFNFSHRF